MDPTDPDSDPDQQYWLGVGRMTNFVYIQDKYTRENVQYCAVRRPGQQGSYTDECSLPDLKISLLRVRNMESGRKNFRVKFQKYPFFAQKSQNYVASWK
jgi:hypothetical protein